MATPLSAKPRDRVTRARSAAPAVRLVGVRRSYGDVAAVAGVDLDIAPGEFFTLLGPSGSGKTTTLRLIAGFEQPDAGRIELGGVDVTRTPPYDRDVNTVFQDYALFPHMSVAENVGYGLRVRGVPRRTRRQQVEEALKMVRLSGFGDRRPVQLSGPPAEQVSEQRPHREEEDGPPEEERHVQVRLFHAQDGIGGHHLRPRPLVDPRHAHRDGQEQQGEDREGAGPRFQEAPDDGAPHPARQVVEHQQGEAADRHAGPEQVREEPRAQRLVQVQERPQHAEHEARGPGQEAGPLQPVDGRRNGEGAVAHGVASLSSCARASGVRSEAGTFWLSCRTRT